LTALPFCRCAAALGVTVLLLRRSILTENWHAVASTLPVNKVSTCSNLARVGDVMDKDVTLLPANTPLPRFSARIASGDPLVCTRQGISLGDDTLRRRSRIEAAIVTYPDETLHGAIARMLRHDIGRLPVVERSNEKKVVGYLGRASIMQARQRYHAEEEDRAPEFIRSDAGLAPTGW
jgi:chloride channel protein, CIC family